MEVFAENQQIKNNLPELIGRKHVPPKNNSHLEGGLGCLFCFHK